MTVVGRRQTNPFRERELKPGALTRLLTTLSFFYTTTKMVNLSDGIEQKKAFLSHAPGYWAGNGGIAPEHWKDWKWQLQNRVTKLGQLEEHLSLSEEERAGVLLSGDKLALAITPHFFSDGKLVNLLSRLRAIPHIEFLRIGTRVPIFLPQRITPELCAMLAKYHPLWMSVHVNHPRALTIEVKEALERLANAGIPLGNQSVLLAGVNDDLETMKTLVHKLLMCRVRPYYLYQCDLINGSSHLRTSVAKGIEIIEGLRGHTTGYAVPQFVIDAPGGGGKVPVNPGYVMLQDGQRTLIRNYEGEVFEYPETGAENVQFAPQREYHDEYLYS